ncbi:MAG: DUF2752 domain-containing protein [Planctomycetes bacterium]|nr:DUF2752 domain-containing protein [Planctomycetota bacterium]MCB9869919.1 DUF2752 domain-containing protein [Planctomycetota bacterium]
MSSVVTPQRRPLQVVLSLAPLATFALLLVYPLYTMHRGPDAPAHPGCAFRALTAHPCPFCGFNRAMVHTYSGDPWGGFPYQPLAVVLLAFVGYLAWRGVRALQRGSVLGLGRWETRVFVAITALSWIAKLLAGPDYY